MPFTQNWFRELNAEANFNSLRYIVNFDNPIKYLEIGVYEGNAHLYMHSKLFKDIKSSSVAIDPFGGGTGNSLHPNAETTFRNNLKDYLDKITIIKNISDNILPTLRKNDFNIIYIDGDHTGDAVYKDAMNSWSLLKNKGIMIFDDYLWHGFSHEMKGTHVEGHGIGDKNHPAVGVNRFLENIKGEYKLLGKKDGLIHDCIILNLDPNITKKLNSRIIKQTHNYQILIQKL